MSACIGCDDTEWFKAYDLKEMAPQPDGTVKVTMHADGSSRIVHSMDLADRVTASYALSSAFLLILMSALASHEK